MEYPYEPDEKWLTYFQMKTAPHDGSSFDVLCRSQTGIEVVVPNLHYGFKPMRDDNEMILWGKTNFLSPYLIPLGWKPRVQSGNVGD